MMPILLTPFPPLDSEVVTCKEAAKLLAKDKVRMVLFRPNGIINYNDPDNDLAYIWREEQ